MVGHLLIPLLPLLFHIHHIVFAIITTILSTFTLSAYKELEFSKFKGSMRLKFRQVQLSHYSLQCYVF